MSLRQTNRIRTASCLAGLLLSSVGLAADFHDQSGCVSIPPNTEIKVKEKFTIPASFEVSIDDVSVGIIRAKPFSSEMILRMGNRSLAKAVVNIVGNAWNLDLYNCKGHLIGRIMAAQKRDTSSRVYDYEVMDALNSATLSSTSASTPSVLELRTGSGSIWNVTRSFSSTLNLWVVSSNRSRETFDARLLAFVPAFKDRLDRETDVPIWRD